MKNKTLLWNSIHVSAKSYYLVYSCNIKPTNRSNLDTVSNILYLLIQTLFQNPSEERFHEWYPSFVLGWWMLHWSCRLKHIVVSQKPRFIKFIQQSTFSAIFNLKRRKTFLKRLSDKIYISSTFGILQECSGT